MEQQLKTAKLEYENNTFDAEAFKKRLFISVNEKQLEVSNNTKKHKMHNLSKFFRGISVRVAFFAIVFLIFSQTAFAEDLIKNVIKEISLGNITAVQIDSSKSKNTMPAHLKGKIFNKDGKAIEVYPQDGSKIYNATGEEIVSFVNGATVTKNQRKEWTLTIKDYTELAKYLSFDAKLPSYLPENYKFDRAELFKDEKGNVSKDYVNLFFTNEKSGKFLYMQQRASKEETKYVTGTDGKIEDIKINGVDAVISDDKNIDWEANNVLYGISSKGAISKNELIKIAESIKS